MLVISGTVWIRKYIPLMTCLLQIYSLTVNEFFKEDHRCLGNRCPLPMGFFFPHCVNWAGKHRGQEEKGATEDERLNDITDSMDMSLS